MHSHDESTIVEVLLPRPVSVFDARRQERCMEEDFTVKVSDSCLLFVGTQTRRRATLMRTDFGSHYSLWSISSL